MVLFGLSLQPPIWSPTLPCGTSLLHDCMHASEDCPQNFKNFLILKLVFHVVDWFAVTFIVFFVFEAPSDQVSLHILQSDRVSLGILCLA